MEGWTLEDRTLGDSRELVLRREGLWLRLDCARPDVQLALAGAPAPLRLAPRLALLGAQPEAWPGPGRSIAVGELRARAGPAWRLEVQSVGAARAGLRWTLELPQSGDGIVLQLALENRSPAPLHVEALVPAALMGERRGVIGLPACHRAWPLASPGDVIAPFSRREPAPRDRRLRGEWRGPLLLRGREAPWLLAGFTTRVRSATRVHVEGADAALRALELRCAGGGRRLAPGETLESERAWLGLGPHAGALLAEWARRCGLESGLPLRRPLVLLRSTCAPGEREARTLRDLGVAAIEDPRTLPAQEPPAPPLAAWARACRAGELVPALRLAPLRSARGVEGRELERPDARAALRAGVAELAGLGVGVFTLEEAARGRARAAEREPGPLRDLLAELRAAAGPEAWLLPDAGAPSEEALGRLDAVALADRPTCGGPLVTLLCRWLGVAPPAGLDGLAGRSRLLARGALAGRAALADPGELDLTRGSLAAAQARLSLASLLAGVLRLRGDPSRLEPARAVALRSALPLLARPGLAADLDSAAGPRTLVVPLLGGRLAVLLLAADGRPTPLGVELRTLGATGPHHVFDFWPGRYLGVVEERVPAAPAAGGGCRLLGLTPVAGRPQLVGSTLHVGMGTLEGFALEEAPGGALRVQLRLPGERSGEVWIAPGGACSARPLAVSFRDAGSFELP